MPRRAVTQAPVEASYRKLDCEIAHVFTHFALRLEVYVADVKNTRAPSGYRWTPARGLDKEAFPGVMRKVIDAVRQSGEIVWDD